MGLQRVKKYDESLLLHEIYRMRGLTVDQLTEVVFDDKEYAYKYLRKMKDNGYLMDRMNMKGRVRLGKVYFCTDKAIERLLNEGLLIKGVMAKDNNPHRSKMKYTIHTNDVYAALMPFGIYMYDSREWKRKHEMDRNALVRGGLRMQDDREFGLYLFFSPEQMSNAYLSDSMLERFKREVKMKNQSNLMVVLCYDEDSYQRVVKAVKEDKEMSVPEELLVIPMGKDDFGFNVLRFSRNEIERKKDLENILNARLNDDREELKDRKNLFTKYIAEYENRETYVVDFLSMNRSTIHHLLQLYNVEAFQRDGREVEIVCWKPNEKELTDLFKPYDHVKVRSVLTSQLKDVYLPQYQQIKLQVD